MHPIRSFADPAQVAADFGGTYCGVEGDERALAALVSAFDAIGARTVAIDAAAKTVYHAASVFASNYLVTVLDAALLRLPGGLSIPEPVARAGRAAGGRIDGQCISAGGVRALTGPIARGDLETVARQQAALDAWDGPSGDLYRALAVATTDLARRR
ncbi:DUF2520 domain-containing protein [Massilia sp. H-1]|nr:DUF2520 domain-containing protein [Massilia sp. H-1]